jgi:hypothetical protein
MCTFITQLITVKEAFFSGPKMVATKGLLWLVLVVMVTAKVHYDKHQVFRLVPEDKEQLLALRELEEGNQGVSCI